MPQPTTEDNLKALVTIILNAPIRIIRFLIKHRGILVGLIILIFALTIYNHFQEQREKSNHYANIPLGKPQQIAQKQHLDDYSVLQTLGPDSYYYVIDMEEDTETIYLKNYWYFEGKKWHHNKKVLPIKKDLYQRVIFYK
jgi:hypothetical protein